MASPATPTNKSPRGAGRRVKRYESLFDVETFPSRFFLTADAFQAPAACLLGLKCLAASASDPQFPVETTIQDGALRLPRRACCDRSGGRTPAARAHGVAGQSHSHDSSTRPAIVVEAHRRIARRPTTINATSLRSDANRSRRSTVCSDPQFPVETTIQDGALLWRVARRRCHCEGRRERIGGPAPSTINSLLRSAEDRYSTVCDAIWSGTLARHY